MRFDFTDKTFPNLELAEGDRVRVGFLATSYDGERGPLKMITFDRGGVETFELLIPDDVFEAFQRAIATKKETILRPIE
jgi:hypothetical protein